VLIQEGITIHYVVIETNTWAPGNLGLTLECAKMTHDHNMDQLKQRELFEIYSFFNNVSMKKGCAMDFAVTKRPPEILLTDRPFYSYYR